MHRRSFIASTIALGALPFVAPTIANAQDDLASKIINDPNPYKWRTEGVREKRVISDDSVMGGKALRVPVLSKGKNRWSVAAKMAIDGAISVGDPIMVAIYAKCLEAESGTGTAAFTIQQSSAPYASLFFKDLQIGPDWDMYTHEFVADKDLKAKSADVAVHLADQKQIVLLGPVMVFNMNKKA